jgi:hypothetical protein
MSRSIAPMAFVRRFAVSNAAAHNGARLPDVLDKTNTASQVWAKRAKGSVKRSLMEWRTEGGTAYRSKANEAHMNERFRVESPFPPARRRLSDNDCIAGQGQRGALLGSLRGRDRLRCPETSVRAIRAHHRDRPRDDEDRPGNIVYNVTRLVRLSTRTASA